MSQTAQSRRITQTSTADYSASLLLLMDIREVFVIRFMSCANRNWSDSANGHIFVTGSEGSCHTSVTVCDSNDHRANLFSVFPFCMSFEFGTRTVQPRKTLLDHVLATEARKENQLQNRSFLYGTYSWGNREQQNLRSFLRSRTDVVKQLL